MDWLIWLFFESLPALGAVIGLPLFALLVYWRRGGRGLPLLIGLAVAAVLIAVQSLVVTEREHAGRILKAIESDLAESRTSALAAALAPDFYSGGLDHDGFLAYVRRQLQRVSVRWVDRQNLQVQQTWPDRFAVAASYTADVVVDGYAGTVPSHWSITFARTPEGWKITNIHPLHIGGDSNVSWENIDHR
jgi:hypothetical protein